MRRVSSAPRCCACSTSAASRSTSCACTRRRVQRVGHCRSVIGEVTCQVLADGCFDGLDLVVIDVDDPLALEWAPRAVDERRARGRQVGGVPHGARRPARDRRGQPRRRARHAARASCRRPTAPPRCRWSRWRRCTAPPASARMVVSSYQSVSGAGQPGIHELDEQWTKGAGRADQYLVSGREPADLCRRRGLGPSDRRQRDPARGVGAGSRATRRKSGRWCTRAARSSTHPSIRVSAPACACPCTSATACR